MIWKPLKNNSYYSVNDEGVVKRNAYVRVDKLGRTTQMKEKILKPSVDKDGYKRVMLVVGEQKPKFIPIHRLVAKTFIKNKNNYPCINHKDENKLNNNIENLEWCTVSYNNNYGDRQKRVSKTLGKKIEGTNGVETLTFNSSKEAERYFNKNSSNISMCANGKLATAYGYKWKWVI